MSFLPIATGGVSIWLGTFAGVSYFTREALTGFVVANLATTAWFLIATLIVAARA